MNPEQEEEIRASLGQGFAEYVRSRAQLFEIEWQEASHHLKGKFAPLLLIGLCGLACYALVIFAIVGLLGRGLAAIPGYSWLGWEAAALLIALVHLLLLLKMKRLLAKSAKQPLFEYSRAELKRDRAWILENNPTKKN